MNIQRIILGLGTIAVVGGLAIGGSGAFFSDTETSTGNTFTAGELDLKIDNTSYGFDWNNPLVEQPIGHWGPNSANSWALSDLDKCGVNHDQPCLFFSFRDLKPGDYGEDTISLHVQNNAWACMAFDLTGTPENGVNEPEAAFPDLTVGPNEGELQNYLSFIFWNDDGDNVLEEEEQVIRELSGLPGSIFTGNWLPIAEAGDTPLQASSTTFIGKGWCFGKMVPTPVVPAPNLNGPTPGNTGFTCDGSGDHNIAQTDGIVVDVKFYSEQSRNNPNFVCPKPEEPVVTTLTLAKAVLPPEVALDTAYTLSATGPTPISGVEGAPAVTAAPITPGVYTLGESGGPAGATSIVWECSGNATPEVDDVIGTGGSVTIAAGEAVICGVTNLYEGPGPFPTP